LVAIIHDARISAKTDTGIVVERILSISGEDALSVNRKYRTSVDAKLAARLMILTNELPRLGDSSSALAGRLLVLRIIPSFFGREDTGLTARLMKELPGILRWAIGGWELLRFRERFTQPESGIKLADAMEEMSSPVSRFVGECCIVEEDKKKLAREWSDLTCKKTDLYDVYSAWSEIRGTQHPGNSAVFGRDLYAALPFISEAQPREKEGKQGGTGGAATKGEKKKRVQSYRGIALNEDALTALALCREGQEKGCSGDLVRHLRNWIVKMSDTDDAPDVASGQTQLTAGSPATESELQACGAEKKIDEIYGF
jgi:phage/plasmid-associated DNA primase